MNKELKEKFIEKFNKEWASEKMQNFCASRLSNGYELQNGYLIEFQKPYIKKDFCFGAGQNGVVDEESWDRANEMAHVASTSENYFIKRNFEEAFGNIEEVLNDEEPLFLVTYDNRGYGDIRNIKTSRYMLIYANEYEKSHARQIAKIDIKNLLAVLEEEKQKLQKRLNTYLKKYGLSKVNSWSFISD